MIDTRQMSGHGEDDDRAAGEIRYVRLGTANLEQAVEFAQKILGWQLAARERNRAYLRSDDREYSYVA